MAMSLHLALNICTTYNLCLFSIHATCMCDIPAQHLPFIHNGIALALRHHSSEYKHPHIIYMYIYFNMYISSPGSPSSAWHVK